MKGVILAGGSGTRLHPATLAVSKQLLPVYDKPLVYYPLSLLMTAGVRDVMVISTAKDLPAFQALFGDGGQLGMAFSYAVQPRPEGIAQAFAIARDFIAGDRCALALGDNLLHGRGLQRMLRAVAARARGATVFAVRVADPERFGVIEFDAQGAPLRIVEKPSRPTSNWAVIGLYFYDAQVVDIAAGLKPSARGELEISDVNRVYLERGELACECLPDSYAWFDAGASEALMKAARYVRATQRRQGVMVGCIEEIAFRQGFIDSAGLARLAEPLSRADYGQRLLALAREAPA